MPTRRKILLSVGVLGTLAGCNERHETSSPDTMCENAIRSNGGEVVFTLTPATRSPEISEQPLLELVIPIRQATIESEGVDQVSVFNDENLLYQIPVNQNDEPIGETNRYDTDDVVEYSQSIGHFPQTGIYRIVALDSAGEQLDQLVMIFRCYIITDEDGS